MPAGHIRPELQSPILRFAINNFCSLTVFQVLAGVFTGVALLVEFLLKIERQRLITQVVLLATWAMIGIAYVYLLFTPIYKMGEVVSNVKQTEISQPTNPPYSSPVAGSKR